MTTKKIRVSYQKKIQRKICLLSVLIYKKKKNKSHNYPNYHHISYVWASKILELYWIEYSMILLLMTILNLTDKSETTEKNSKTVILFSKKSSNFNDV